MLKTGPIILVDDDEDEFDLMQQALAALNISNELIWFEDGRLAFEYLASTNDKPLMILADVNMPVMDGLALREKIDQNPQVKKKSIPFIFFTTTATRSAVEKAYDLSVQGFFEKPTTFDHYEALIKRLYDYWQDCLHPNE